MNLIPFAIGLIKDHWRIALLALVLLALTIQTFRLSATQASLEAETAGRLADAASYAQAQAEATAIALSQRARDEAKYQEKADEADQKIADFRDDLRARLVRAEAINRASRAAAAAPQGGDPRLPEEVPTTATGDSGSVQVSADTMAGLAAYAIKAHEWAQTLDD